MFVLQEYIQQHYYGLHKLMDTSYVHIYIIYINYIHSIILFTVYMLHQAGSQLPKEQSILFGIWYSQFNSKFPIPYLLVLYWYLVLVIWNWYYCYYVLLFVYLCLLLVFVFFRLWKNKI